MIRALKFISEELTGEVLVRSLGRVVSLLWGMPGLKDVAGKGIYAIVDNFMPNEVADEQLYNAAITKPPVTPEDNRVLHMRLAALPRSQRNHFRLKIAQAKYVDKNKIPDVEETAKVLHTLAMFDDETWKDYVKVMELDKPATGQGVVIRIQRRASKVSRWGKKKSKQYSAWVNRDLKPAINKATCDLNAAAAKTPDWM